MARSNRTLSGCFESTFAIGLLTFLLVQATVTASTPNRRITGIRRDIENLRTLHPLQSSLGSGFQQFLCVTLWIAFTEHSVACDQNFSSGSHDVAYRIQSDAAIHLNPIIEPALLAQLG